VVRTGRGGSLSELATTDDKETAVEVDIAQAQAAHLACPQSQPIAERENSAIGRTSLGSRRPVRKGSGSLEQLTCLGTVEHKRDTAGGYPSLTGPQRRDLQELPADGPIEKASNDAQQVVEAAWTDPGSGCQKVLQHCRGDLVERRHTSLVQEAHQESQLARLTAVLAAQSLLVRRELLHDEFYSQNHASTSSPSPRATWRRDLHGHLGVDLRRGRRAVPDKISDGFERKIGVHQSLYAGVTQCVRPGANNLNPRLLQIVRGSGGDSR
jgi:hypothetical protein